MLSFVIVARRVDTAKKKFERDRLQAKLISFLFILFFTL